MRQIDSGETVAVGDEVVTAGIELGGGVRSPYPKGLLIGQVVDVKRDANDVVQTAFLQPAAQLDKLEYLLVITDYQGGLPPIEQQPVDCGDGRRPARGRAALPVAEPSAEAEPRARPAPTRQAVTVGGAGRPRLLPFPAMKGIVLAGGTATRLYPLTIVTNKHLLPIYDRPMIYYPIETLAGMGIREVMVIVGGKSVGDVVELLADGSAFGIDLTYRYQPGALGHRPRHRAGPRLRRRRRVLLRPRRQHPARAGRWPTSPPSSSAGRTARARCSTRSPTPSASAWPSSTPTAGSIGFEEKPDQPKSDLIPIGVYFLRPDAFAVIDHLLPSGRGELEITDVLNHYIPGRRPLQPGLRRATGPTPGPSRRSCARPSWPPPTTPPAGCRRRSPGRSADVAEDARVRAACWSPAGPGSSARATSATSWAGATGRGSPSSTS